MTEKEDDLNWSSSIIDLNNENVITTPFASPEIAILLHLLVDEPVDFSMKVNATQMLIDSRLLQSSSSQNVYLTTYFELLLGVISVYASIVNTPKGLGGSEMYSTIWQSTLCGLIPSIISEVESNRNNGDNKEDVEQALITLFERCQTTLEQCEAQYKSVKSNKKNDTNTNGEDMDTIMMESLIGGGDDDDNEGKKNPVRAALIQSFVDRNLINLERWNVGKRILEDSQMILKPCQIIQEAKHSSMSIKDYISQQLSNGSSFEDSWLVERMIEDYSVQELINVGLLEKMIGWTNENELESLSKISSFLLENNTALHVWLFYVSPTNALQPVCTLFDHPESLQSGEDPSILAPIILLGQYIVQIGLNSGSSLDQLCSPFQFKFFPSIIRSLTSIKPLDQFLKQEKEIISNWILALFGSEGISDDLIRSSSPQLLLRITPTIFSQAIKATVFGVIDTETLRGGLTYFLQDLLSYTLPGALRSVTNEIGRCNTILQTNSGNNNSAAASGMNETDLDNLRKSKEICLEVLMSILQAESCPETVKRLVCQQVITVLEQSQSGALNGTTSNNNNNNNNNTPLPFSEQIEILIQSLSQFSQSQNQFKRTDIWIKLASSSTVSIGGLDPLLNMGASLYSIMTQRGIEAIINLIKKSVRIDDNNDNGLQKKANISIQKSIAFSLGLIILREIVENIRNLNKKNGLADQNSIKVISTLLQQVGDSSSFDSILSIMNLIKNLCDSLSSFPDNNNGLLFEQSQQQTNEMTDHFSQTISSKSKEILKTLSAFIELAKYENERKFKGIGSKRKHSTFNVTPLPIKSFEEEGEGEPTILT